MTMPKRPLLIGLTGKARSGKDTCGRELQLMTDITPYAMAQPIKEACAVIFNWDHRHLHGELKEVIDPVYDVTPREAMQKLGTEYGRGMINTNLWELRAVAEIEAKQAKGEAMVITDLRFDNEAQMVRSMGGIVIEVVRDNPDNIQGVKGHASEQGISTNLIDFTLENNGTFQQLYTALYNTLGEYNEQCRENAPTAKLMPCAE